MTDNCVPLGKKQHTSDHWWAAAFDKQLKSLDVSQKSGEVTVKQTAPAPLVMAAAERYYIRFVPGGVLTGSVETPLLPPSSSPSAVSVVTKNERNSSLAEKVDNNAPKRMKEKEKDKKKRRCEDRKKEESRRERKDKRRLKRLFDKEMALLQAPPLPMVEA
jgi:hypothetical protein